MTKNKAKELSYYLFFGLMVLAKGIGLDSGVRLYYLLSAAACLCLGVKLVLTKYSTKQIGAMAVLCIIAFVSYRNSGRLGIVLTVLALIGLKDMDIKKLFRMGLVIYGCSFVWTVVMAKWGVIHNPLDVHRKGGVELIRWGMGYSTGNVFHASYFILTVFLCYTWGKRYDIKRTAVLMAGNLAVFLFSLSYTGVIVVAFFLFLFLYAVKRGKPGRVERFLFQLPLPLCLAFSFGTPFLLDIPLVQKVDAMMQARLSFSAYYLKNQPITLFGARMKDVPNFWVIMDNGYVYIFMTFGIVAFALFCAGYAVLAARYSGFPGSKRKAVRSGADENGVGTGGTDGAGKGGRLQELSIIFAFLLYGIMEQFISNAFMNLSLFFFGELLFGTGSMEAREAEEARGESADGRKRCARAAGDGKEAVFGIRQWICCAGTGVAVAVLYQAFVPPKEFVRVPLESLLYVDAWSVEVGVGGMDKLPDTDISMRQSAGIPIKVGSDKEQFTKEELKEWMNCCRSMIEKPEAMEEMIRKAGLEEKLSAEEVAAATEYSIPVSVQSSKIYDRFRIRLLELYCRIDEEEYARLMNQIVQIVGQSGESVYKVDAGSIYRERIEKSAGNDRIEHISGEKEYLVEKNGSLVTMEHFRDGVFYGIMAMAAAVLLWSLLGWRRKRSRRQEDLRKEWGQR